MHISLEDFNLLLAQKVTGEKRARIVDHILTCENCATRFRALNALDRHMHEETARDQVPQSPVIRFPLRYILGAAAIIFMCLAPYLFRGPEVAPALQQAQTDEALPFFVVDKVKEVNFQAALTGWNRENTLIDLVNMQNGLN